MRIPAWRSLAATLIMGSVSFLGAPRAQADNDNHWPVRLSTSVPLGYTVGGERLEGFTWGFRAQASVHPSPTSFAVGGFAEILLDLDTDSLATFGSMVSLPVRTSQDLDIQWRATGSIGARFAGYDDTTRAAVSLGTDIAFPFYLYELRLGFRIDGTFDPGLTSVGMLVDLDLLALGAAALGSK